MSIESDITNAARNYEGGVVEMESAYSVQRAFTEWRGDTALPADDAEMADMIKRFACAHRGHERDFIRAVLARQYGIDAPQPVPVNARVAALRKRRHDAGLTRIEVWAHPDDHQAIRDEAARLAKARDAAANMADQRKHSE